VSAGNSAGLALRTLRANPFRTLLTMLSVTIGAFSIVAMLSLAQSGHRTLAHTIESIGGARLVLWIPNEDRTASGREKAVYDKGFTDRDLAALRELPHVASVALEAPYGREAVWGSPDRVEQADIVGVSRGLLEILTWDVLEGGRRIEDADNLEKRRVAVISAELAESLYEGRADVVGETLTVGRKPYTVVGVLEKRDLMGIQMGFTWTTSVFVPLATAEKREGRSELYRFVIALTADPDHNESVVQLANGALLSNHRGVEDFQSLDFGGFIEQFYTFFRILDLIVAVIAGVSLFAGGIGVMNIMLVSVTERVREIGIRRSLGATRPNILAQFLIEATTLSMTGGLLGVALALVVVTGAHLLVQQFLDTWVATYSAVGVFASLGMTAFIGLVFGAVPAWRASRLDIIECLRR
jgi:putative ABC transport system permease protein